MLQCQSNRTACLSAVSFHLPKLIFPKFSAWWKTIAGIAKHCKEPFVIVFFRGTAGVV